MKSIKLNIGLFICGLTLFTACNSGATTENKTDQTEVKQEVAGINYTCSMHPEVVSAEPGKCPKCGMNLEEVKAVDHQHEAGEQH